MLLENMEENYTGKKLEYIESLDMYILCENNALNITSEALDFIRFIKNELKNINLIGNMIDIGAGIGTLSFFLSKERNFSKIDLIEIQKEVFEILEFNVNNNKLDFNLINNDANILKKYEYNKKYSFVVSNPPFYKINSGFLPKNEIIRNSKFEILLKLNDLLDIVYNILSDNGFFFLILPLERKKEILKDKRFKILNFYESKNKKKNFIFFNITKGKV